MKVKKVLKVVFIVILIVIVLVLINTIRKFIIVRDLQDKLANYEESTNYHIKTVQTEASGIEVTTNYYRKDGKQKVILETEQDGEVYTITTYSNGDRVDIFYDNSDGKSVELDADSEITVNFYNYIECDSKIGTFFACILANVKNATYDDTECYLVSNFITSMALYSGDGKDEVYIDKETGLYVNANLNGANYLREYEFDTVTDEIFVEPDIDDYTIIESE